MSKLRFDPVSEDDERVYYLVAENDRGRMRESMMLRVTDPVAMETVIGKIFINRSISYIILSF